MISETLNAPMNYGYDNDALMDFLRGFPRASYLMRSMGLAYGVAESQHFPASGPYTSDNIDTGLVSFQNRVALHTTAVGLTYYNMLSALREKGAIHLNDDALRTGAEAMINHDLYKVQEIMWRKDLGSADAAYNKAEERSGDILRAAGFPEEYVIMAGSIGINGAKDFMIHPDEWPLIRQAAYLADELHQETIIQVDPFAKITRLKGDTRYEELNKTGFPDMRGHPAFEDQDNNLLPKFEVQERATRAMVENVARALDIASEDLGKYLIRQATGNGSYLATNI